MACSPIFGGLTFLVAICLVGYLALPWLPWAKFSSHDSGKLFQWRNLVTQVCVSDYASAETVDRLESANRFYQEVSKSASERGINFKQKNYADDASNLYSETLGKGCIPRQTFEIVALGGVLASAFAVLLALALSCAICCNCCKNKYPAMIMTGLMGCSAIALVLTLVVYGSQLALNKKTDRLRFHFGFFIAIGMALTMCGMMILAAVTIFQKGDLVRYPKDPRSGDIPMGPRDGPGNPGKGNVPTGANPPS